MSFICSGHACSTVNNLHIWSSGIADEQHLFTAAAAPGSSFTQGNSITVAQRGGERAVDLILCCSVTSGGGEEGVHC